MDDQCRPTVFWFGVVAGEQKEKCVWPDVTTSLQNSFVCCHFCFKVIYEPVSLFLTAKVLIVYINFIYLLYFFKCKIKNILIAIFVLNTY